MFGQNANTFGQPSGKFKRKGPDLITFRFFLARNYEIEMLL